MKKWKIISLSIFISYLVFAQSCLKMRVKDSEAKNKFETKGVKLTFKDFLKDDLKIHYAQTGIENASTIFYLFMVLLVLGMLMKTTCWIVLY
jgi:hypothetical protein